MLEDENEALQQHLEQFEEEKAQLRKKHEDYKKRINMYELERADLEEKQESLVMQNEEAEKQFAE